MGKQANEKAFMRNSFVISFWHIAAHRLRNLVRGGTGHVLFICYMGLPLGNQLNLGLNASHEVLYHATYHTVRAEEEIQVINIMGREIQLCNQSYNH